MGERVAITLVCAVCEARNYKTTRKTSQRVQLELKKYCPRCNGHTLHKETK